MVFNPLVGTDISDIALPHAIPFTVSSATPGLSEDKGGCTKLLLGYAQASFMPSLKRQALQGPPAFICILHVITSLYANRSWWVQGCQRPEVMHPSSDNLQGCLCFLGCHRSVAISGSFSCICHTSLFWQVWPTNKIEAWTSYWCCCDGYLIVVL